MSFEIVKINKGTFQEPEVSKIFRIPAPELNIYSHLKLFKP
jgi:hypothetical protein